MLHVNHPNCSLCSEASCATAFLSKSQLSKLSTSCHEGSIGKGEILTFQGSQTSRIIYIRSGLVKEYLETGQDENCIIQIIKPLSYLGLHSIFAGRVNHYSYAALEDCRICNIDARVFRQLILENGEFANSIMESMSNESLNSHHRFLNLRLKQTYGKLADALLYFSDIIYENDQFVLGLTRQEVASMIGVSRESTTRAMQYLKDEGVIQLSGRNINIIDKERLERISKTS